MEYEQWSSMASGLDTVYSTAAVAPANGCFSPVDRVRNLIRQRLGALFRKNGRQVRLSREDSQTYFLKFSTVTSRSWDGSMLKSRGTKSNFSVHWRIGMPRRRDGNCTKSIASLPLLCAQTFPFSSQRLPLGEGTVVCSFHSVFFQEAS